MGCGDIRSGVLIKDSCSCRDVMQIINFHHIVKEPGSPVSAQTKGTPSVPSGHLPLLGGGRVGV